MQAHFILEILISLVYFGVTHDMLESLMKQTTDTDYVCDKVCVTVFTRQ